MDKRKSNASLPTSFLQKTFDMVSNEELSKVVSWSEDGCAFIIKDVSEFTDKVLPRYFKHSNYASFVRQLNMYDFHKCRVDGQENAFVQPLFRKDSRQLLPEIKRKVSDNSYSLVPIAASRPEAQSIMHKLQKFKQTQDELKTDLQTLQTNYDNLSRQNTRLLGEIATVREKEQRFEQVLLLLANWFQNPQKQLDAQALFEAFHAKTLATEDYSNKHFYLPSTKQAKVREVVDDLSYSDTFVKDDSDSLSLPSPLMLPAPGEFTDDPITLDMSFDEMLS
mmetsp:Transcript_27651/g.49925  ORF Transcript_27651/g.49925 Transcript_27651/m.49925 type:complete len:279 (-) Transcript_27651:1324-2160(-)